MLPKVKIMMSTYNGEKYIQEQLNSLLNQINVNVDIVIRDDGSIDKTCELLAQFSSDNRNIYVINSENIGSCESFLELFYGVSEGYDYYAFSDQDDIWEEDKISHAIDMMNEIGSKKPILYYSSLKTFNSETGEKKLKKNDRQYSFEETFIQSQFPGCTMIINKAGFNLIRSIDRPHRTIMHDLFVVQVFMGTHNKIIYDEESRINYRIHGNNVSVKPDSFLDEIRRICKILSKQKALRLNSAREYYRVMNEHLSDDDSNIVKIIIKYKDSLSDKIKMIQLINSTNFTKKIKLAYSMAVVFNFY